MVRTFVQWVVGVAELTRALTSDHGTPVTDLGVDEWERVAGQTELTIWDRAGGWSHFPGS